MNRDSLQVICPWRPVHLNDFNELKQFAADARRFLPNLKLHQDPEHVAAHQGWPANPLLILSCQRENQLQGLAVFRIERVPLVHAIGPFVLMRPKVERYYLFEGPAFSNAAHSADSTACFDHLADVMPDDGVVFAFAVPVESDLHNQLTDGNSPLRNRFHALPWGRVSPSCSISWDGSVENYLKTISASRRGDLRRRHKKFQTDTTLIGKTRCFRLPDEVDDFLRDGTRISDTTWQKAEHGTGISAGGATERTIRAAAERGALLGYILYIDNRPAAFMCCFIEEHTCTVEQIGYDPIWTPKHHVGSILFLEMLYSLQRDQVPVNSIDFLSTSNLFKLQTTNRRYPVRNFYLFKRSPIGTLRYTTMRATDALSRFGAVIAQRFGLHDKPA